MTGVLAAGVSAGSMQPCSRNSKVDPSLDVREPDLIVVAMAAEYIQEPESNSHTTGEPESVIRFDGSRP